MRLQETYLSIKINGIETIKAVYNKRADNQARSFLTCKKR